MYGVQFECEYLTFGAPILMPLHAGREPGGNLSYPQKADAMDSSVLIFNLH
jgi:hypothetical protein